MAEDYGIYINIHQFIKYRYDVEISPLSREEFTKSYLSNKYIDIKTKDVVIILTMDGGEYSGTGAAIKKILVKYMKQSPSLKELILVSRFNFIVVNNGVIADLVAAKKLVSDLTSGDDRQIWVQVRPKSIFYTVIPSITWLSPHRRIDQSIITGTGSKWIDIKTLPRIEEFDPYVTWIGARAGEVIEIDRYTPSVGKQSIYRLVK